jgi:hypothetical protein
MRGLLIFVPINGVGWKSKPLAVWAVGLGMARMLG